MRLAEGSITLSLPLLLLGLWVLLAPGQCSQGRPSWRYISSEVVVPRKELHHGKGVQLPGWLSYSLSFGGQRHLIHMRRKRLFWSRNLVLMTQDDQGSLQVDYPFFPLDCYYLGYLEDVPLSMVTMDTCYGGLEGIMKLDDLAYEIKPLRDSQRFEHVVSQIIADTNATGPLSTLGPKEERDPQFSELNPSTASRISSKLYASHRANMKGCLMTSYSVFNLYRNVTYNIKFLVHLGSLLDSMLRGLDIRYYISIMVLYVTRDPTPMNNFFVPQGVFARHFYSHIFVPYAPHTGLIFVRDAPHELNFTPNMNSMCSQRSLIYIGHLYRHYLLLSIIAAHQTAVTMGVKLDTSNCVCQRRATCIMNRYPVLTDAFSNCSVVYLQDAFSDPNPHVKATCLFAIEEVHYNWSLTYWVCGNAVKDPGELCDCGSFKQCSKDPCCETNCRLTASSACAVGPCCIKCKIALPGTLCRPVQNICDLPEYCNGKHMTCPQNLYLQDGTPCSEDGYCYHGNCTDRSMHCKEIFGEGALNAPDVCYSINKKANRFGHCHLTQEFHPEPCNERHLKCGRLQCTNVTHLPRLQEHVGFHQSLIEGSSCFGVGAHRASGTTDVGAVRPGTPCGHGIFCLEGFCNSSVSDISYNCLPSKCHYRGVCNNKKSCHCYRGFKPPWCKLKGSGGSLHSGPMPRQMRTPTQNNLSMMYLRLIFVRLFTIIAALLVGIVMKRKTIETPEVTEVRAGTSPTSTTQ